MSFYLICDDRMNGRKMMRVGDMSNPIWILGWTRVYRLLLPLSQASHHESFDKNSVGKTCHHKEPYFAPQTAASPVIHERL